MPEESRGQNPKSPTPPGQSPWAFAGLGAQFFFALLVFVYAGNWMDARYGSSPLFLLSGLFLGGGGTFYLSYRRLMRSMNAADERKKSSSDNTPRL